MARPLNLHDFEALARERMDPAAFAFYAGGAGDEETLRENEAAFARRRLRPRVLVDVSEVDLATALLEQPVTMPVGIAPTALHGLAHPDAEAATARAAAEEGVLFCASTSSTLAMEDIAAASEGPRWFQLYVQDNEGPRTEALVRRAEAAAYSAIVLTVDLPVSGRRERDLRESFDIHAMHFGNAAYGAAAGAPPHRITWESVEWLRRLTPLPIVLKGIMTAEDARLAVEHGAAAVWVSNHGGRQLDRSPAAVDVLEEIVGATAGRAEVYMDGGVRRGVDVVTALALGARAVFIGRPILYALAADGAAGVEVALDLIRSEVENAMALLGTPTVASITRAHVV